MIKTITTAVALATVASSTVAETKTFVCKTEGWLSSIQVELKNVENLQDCHFTGEKWLNSDVQSCKFTKKGDLYEYNTYKKLDSSTDSVYKRTGDFSQQTTSFDWRWSKNGYNYFISADNGFNNMEIYITEDDWSSSEGEHYDVVRDEACTAKYYR